MRSFGLTSPQSQACGPLAAMRTDNHSQHCFHCERTCCCGPVQVALADVCSLVGGIKSSPRYKSVQLFSDVEKKPTDAFPFVIMTDTSSMVPVPATNGSIRIDHDPDGQKCTEPRSQTRPCPTPELEKTVKIDSQDSSTAFDADTGKTCCKGLHCFDAYSCQLFDIWKPCTTPPSHRQGLFVGGAMRHHAKIGDRTEGFLHLLHAFYDSSTDSPGQHRTVRGPFVAGCDVRN